MRETQNGTLAQVYSTLYWLNERTTISHENNMKYIFYDENIVKDRRKLFPQKFGL